jgi:hypothetical protein
MRKETWDIDLMDFLKSKENTPFQWGVHDCIMFAVGCAQAMTGIDLAEKYRGYSTQEEAAQIIKKARGFLELVTENMGEEITPNFARRGDWIMIETEGQPALSVCMGTTVIAAGRDGLVRHPMNEALAAWRID